MMMKTVKHLLCCAIAASALISTGAASAGWRGTMANRKRDAGREALEKK
ncbi:hypothetical protein O5343_27045, partial [Escherichia coli]|nr:hypothetical protein [Escherichia coli]